MMILKDYTVPRLASITKVVRMGTLGPEGTSSEYAAHAFVRSYLSYQGLKGEVYLSNTFEECISKLFEDSLDCVIVPHAYEEIKDFYMRPDIDLIQLFRCDTPMYGIAIRPEFKFHLDLLESETIVSHPAPINLIKYFLGKEAKVLTVNSTSIAASMVQEGIYNLAITNEIAKEKYKLNFIYTFKSIPMSWSVFGRRDSNETNFNR